jgi:Flp pilus assembly protein TadG
MSSRNRAGQRRGALAVEGAVVFPVVLFLLLSLVVGGMGIFRYQQVACLAREAARWAAVRGADYQKENHKASPSQSQILQQAVLPLAVGMDATQLTATVEWVDNGANTVTPWDTAYHAVKTLDSTGEYVSSSVRVTVTYQWSPLLIVGTISLTSVSQMPMSY